MALPSSSSSSSGTTTIRPATRNDISTIIDLIRQLAIYEKEPEAAKATPDLIQRNIFEKEIAKCLIAEVETQDGKKQPIGMAIYYFSFSTWTARPSLYLEDLFVTSDYRNAGIGKALFRSLGEIAKENNCARMDWSVLDWNEPSIAFYTKVLGAKPMDGWTGMRLEEEGIDRLQTLGLKGSH